MYEQSFSSEASQYRSSHSPQAQAFPSPSTSSSPRGRSSSGGGKRKQVKNACVNCQKACKKCDDQRPCSRCVKYGIEEGCVNSQRKERKRKSANHNNNNNSTGDDLDDDDDEGSSDNESVISRSASPLRLRLSARQTRQPLFSKELLDSLQQQEKTEKEKALVASTISGSNDHHGSSLAVNYICPRVTEEFKTLAHICSDIHTVLSTNHQLQQQLQQQQQQQHIQQYQQQQQQQYQQFYQSRPLTPLNPFMMRGSSPPPPHLLLRPSSPIYQAYNGNPSSTAASTAINNANIHSQPHFISPQPQPPHHTQAFRNFLNRTPPDDDENGAKNP